MQLDGFGKGFIELGLVAVMGLAMACDRRRRGTYPTRRPPRQLRPAIARRVRRAVLRGLLGE